jgi:hypothetical protein
MKKIYQKIGVIVFLLSILVVEMNAQMPQKYKKTFPQNHNFKGLDSIPFPKDLLYRPDKDGQVKTMDLLYRPDRDGKAKALLLDNQMPVNINNKYLLLKQAENIGK